MTGDYADIPRVMISKPDGALIKAALAAGNVTVTLTPDNTPALGYFNNRRGASDSIFPVNVATPGVYPLRTVWFEGGGGANLELFRQTPNGDKILLNDSTNPNSLKTFQARTISTPPVITKVALGVNVLRIEWTGGGTPEMADEVTGPWASTGLSSPADVPIDRVKRFGRVRR
jgi:hypothetical protein